MKYGVIALMLAAGTAQAESQCLLSDERRMLAELDGFWEISGSMVVSVLGDSFVDPFQARMQVTRGGTITFYKDGGRGDTVRVSTNNGALDTEDLAKYFEMTQADFVAEAVANSPCPPEDTLQFRETFDDPNGQYNEVTLIPFFSDKMVMVLDVEAACDLGLMFITMVGLMTPAGE